MTDTGSTRITSRKSSPFIRRWWMLAALFVLNACGGVDRQANAGGDSVAASVGGAPLVLKENTVVALIYHRVGDSRYPSTNTSISQFESHLNYLKSNGYKVLTLGDVLSTEVEQTDKNIVVLTIDDAFKSFFENGFPLLKKYGFKATLFVNTETVGGNDYMSWKQIKEMMTYGVEIGNHSHSHAYFLNNDKEDIQSIFKDDIRTANELLEKHLGFIPSIFAYPYGEYNLEMKGALNGLGIKVAMAQKSGVISRYSDMLALPRFPMSSAYADLQGFIEKVNMKPLDVMFVSPTDPIIGGDNLSPELSITFHKGTLNLQQMQCFIQGAECEFNLTENAEGGCSLKIQPKGNLTRRRTLYTITAPDENGAWHWFSYLWVNPGVE